MELPQWMGRVRPVTNIGGFRAILYPIWGTSLFESLAFRDFGGHNVFTVDVVARIGPERVRDTVRGEDRRPQPGREDRPVDVGARRRLRGGRDRLRPGLPVVRRGAGEPGAARVRVVGRVVPARPDRPRLRV